MTDIMILALAVFQIFMSKGCFTIQNGKVDIIQPNIYRILPEVKQVIYTSNTNCMPDIIAQGVIQILPSQGVLWVICLSLKRGIIQSNIHINF